MPNHVTNTIELYSDEKGLVDRVLEEIKGEREVIDFAVLIPQPENLYMENLSGADRIRCAEEGIPNWYDWQVENWGTKWNAYSQSVEDAVFGVTIIRFDTAWAPPLPVIEALRNKYPELHVAGSWLEEGHQSAGVF